MTGLSGRGQPSAGRHPVVRVSRPVYDELAAVQREIKAEQGWLVSLSDIIGKMLADRKAWRAMGEAAREADRKPVPS